MRIYICRLGDSGVRTAHCVMILCRLQAGAGGVTIRAATLLHIRSTAPRVCVCVYTYIGADTYICTEMAHEKCDPLWVGIACKYIACTIPSINNVSMLLRETCVAYKYIYVLGHASL